MATYTYKAEGNREDLADFITNISKDPCVLQQKFGRTSVTAMKHDWLN